jgi:hypothetical protein
MSSFHLLVSFVAAFQEVLSLGSKNTNPSSVSFFLGGGVGGVYKNRKYNLLIYISQSSLTIYKYTNKVIFYTHQVYVVLDAQEEVFLLLVSFSFEICSNICELILSSPFDLSDNIL